MNSIKLSVCIPTYNREQLLKQTIESIIAEIDIKSAEIIVSDNASADNTEAVVKELMTCHPCIKYFKNKQNIGLDENTLECIRKASGQYCWLCSDDDIVLSGAYKKILSVIDKHAPNFIYLNYAGFIENEDYRIIYKRNTDKEDVVYTDSEKMLRDLLLNHFSAIVFKTDVALNYYTKVIEEYKNLGYQRGYSLVTNIYIIKETKVPFVFIGKLCLAVRNPLKGNNYNPLTIIIDVARIYQYLVKKGVVSEFTENYIVNMYLRGFYKLVLPRKCFGSKEYTQEYADEIIRLCKKYSLFKFYLYPCLILPRWILFLPYVIIRYIKAIFRKIFNFSPF